MSRPDDTPPALQKSPSQMHNVSINTFLEPSFDPVEYLNSVLPPLSSSSTVSENETHAAPLSELSTRMQSLLSQLNAQSTRNSDSLNTLTDDILKSGPRLAYEVEVLRGDAAGLIESLQENLKEDIGVFVALETEASVGNGPENAQSRRNENQTAESLLGLPNSTTDPSKTPSYVLQLRLLTNVRKRLETVVKAFGEAMEWIIPPSEVSVASSFISVSAPEPGSESHSREEKGQRVAAAFRDEISKLFSSGSTPATGVEAATKRVDELQELLAVWKGTAEEKSRTKFVESLSKMVEAKQRQVDKEAEVALQRKMTSNASPSQGRGGVPRETEAQQKQDQSRSAWPSRDVSYGFINQLQKMRGGL